MRNHKILILALVLIGLILLQNFEPIGPNSIFYFSALEIILIILLLLSIQKRLKSNDKTKREENECSDNILQLMKVYRHDWQNHLQIILGYVSLKKYDQIPKYIAKVTETAKKFSIISSYANKELAVFLYMIPVKYPKINIELEIEEGKNYFTDSYFNAELLLIELREFIELFYKTVETNLNHLLIISLVAVDDNIILTFEYEGDIKAIYREVIDLAAEFKQHNGKYLIDIYNDEEFIMELHFPLN